tara:strand:+ start:2192 stop:3484 length:1293 start_codon:yes stop_codon:yes gene_type:complete
MKTNIDISKKNGILLKNGLIIDVTNGKSFENDILIVDGIIKKIGDIQSNEDYYILDCKNKVITQSFVDIGTNLKTPGVGDQETLESGSVSALAGGFTKICIVSSKDNLIDSPEIVKLLTDHSKELPIAIYPMCSVTKNNDGLELTEMGLMKDKGAVAFYDDNSPLMNSQVLRYALEYSKMFNIPVMNHPEDLNLVNNGLVNESPHSNSMGLNGNPSISESIMINRDLAIANYVKGRIHIPNVTCESSIEIIKKYKKNNKLISCNTSPHYLYFNDSDLLDFNTNLKVSPPIRSNKDRLKLIDAIKSGIIDSISSNHNPHRIDDKEKDFQNAKQGVIGLETSFSVAHTILSSSNMPIEEIINLFSRNPAKIMNIKLNKIKINENSELTIIDPHKKWKFTKDNIYSKSSNSPFLNETLKGRVDYTINKNILFG